MRQTLSRASVGALGIGLVVLIGIAWGTGALYVAVRLGLPAPVRLAAVDAVHVYVGIAAAAFLVLKIGRVGLRGRVSGVPEVQTWQRWVSWSLAVLYGLIFVSGVAAVLPLGARGRSIAVNLHLLSSVWALVPTTWHAFHYRRLGVPFLTRWSGSRFPRRLWGGIAVASLPAFLFAGGGQALSGIAAGGGGGSWNQAGLAGISVNGVAATRDGRLLAYGDGLYLSRDGRNWQHADLPSGGPESERLIDLGIRPPAVAPEAAPGAGGHDHGAASATAGAVLSAALTNNGHPFLGATDGIYYSPWPEGPYVKLPFPARPVSSLAVAPGSNFTVWALDDTGPWLSIDGGHTWTLFARGLRVPGSAVTIVFFRTNAYLSDVDGVKRFDLPTTAWMPAGGPAGQSLLSVAGDRLYASTEAGGAQAFDGRSWQPVTALDGHQHGGAAAGHAHGVALRAAGGRLFALDRGVAAAGPDGRDLTTLGGDLPAAPREVARLGGWLYAATADGVYRYPLPGTAPAGPSWWILSTLLALALGVTGSILAAFPRAVGREGLEPVRAGASPAA